MLGHAPKNGRIGQFKNIQGEGSYSGLKPLGINRASKTSKFQEELLQEPRASLSRVPSSQNFFFEIFQ